MIIKSRPNYNVLDSLAVVHDVLMAVRFFFDGRPAGRQRHPCQEVVPKTVRSPNLNVSKVNDF